MIVNGSIFIEKIQTIYKQVFYHLLSLLDDQDLFFP